MKVFCPMLLSGKYFPTKCAHRGIQGGQNVSPAIEWTEVPAGTRSFTFTIVDRHPSASNWVHWNVINIPISTREIQEQATGLHRGLPEGSMELRNSFGENGYGGPQPPRGSGPHNYEITVYALDIPALPVGPYATLSECSDAMRGHVLSSGSITGTFEQ
jgi:Raf kinase inhibitor-like YbhB/YbcL family protein